MSDLSLKRALKVTPGASQTASRRHGLVGPFSYPAFATSAFGTYITLEGGDTAIDLAGANATVPLGYNHPDVISAVQRQLGTGGSLSLPSLLEAEASERLVSLLPFPSMVRWVKTGSESVSAAVAIARQLTARKTIGVFEDSYHGWHPWTRDTIKLNRWDFKGLLKVSAVIVESPRWKLVAEDDIEWLKRLRDACTKVGTLLIYDDVVYAFRYHKAGLQGSTGVRPDIACFSKALGNGMPVGCIAGEPDLMNETSYRVSSTFGGEMLGLSAANAVLKLHQEQDICGDLLRAGIGLQEKLKASLKNTPITLFGTPQHFRFEAQSPQVFNQFLELCIGSETDELRVKEGAERLLVHRDANNINLAINEKVADQIAHTVKLAARRCA